MSFQTHSCKYFRMKIIFQTDVLINVLIGFVFVMQIISKLCFKRQSIDKKFISNKNSYSFIISIRTRSEEHTSELQSRENLVCRLLLEKKNNQIVNFV